MPPAPRAGPGSGSTGTRSAKASGVRYQLQLTGRPDDLPLLGGHDTSDDDLSPSTLEVFEGAPLEVFAGEPLVAAYLADILAGTTIITAGVLPAAAYRIRARYVPNGGWCPWIEVETPDTRVSALDLDAALNSRIDDAQSKADAAASDAANAIAAAVEARGIAEALAGETIAELEALLAALAGIDAGDIVENRLLALRALQSGWNADPTFQLWASGSPERWTATGLSGIGGPFAGFYGGGLALDIGAGAVAVTLTASSAVAGQMDAADPDAPWLVLYALVTFASGNADALRLRAEWLPAAGSTWVAGDMKGLTAPVGSFTQLGVGAKPGVMQGVEVLVQRPAGLGAQADAVRLVLQKVSTVTTAVDCDVHLVGLRAASEAEIAAGQAADELAAAVDTLTTEITGVADALAAYRIAADAAVGAVSANLAANYLTTAAVTAAIAAAQTTLTTAIGAVSTTLATNHYTKSEVDGGIATAVGVASTSLGGQIEDLAADLVDEAGFRVSGRRGARGAGLQDRGAQRPGLDRLERLICDGNVCRLDRGAGHHDHRPPDGQRGRARWRCFGAADLSERPHAAVRDGCRRVPQPLQRILRVQAGRRHLGIDALRLGRRIPARRDAAPHRPVPRRRWDRHRVAVRRSRQLRGHGLGAAADRQLRRAREHGLGRGRGPAPSGRFRRCLRHRHRGPQGRRRSAGAHLGRRVRRRRRLRGDHLAADEHQRQLRLAERLPLADLDRGRHGRRADVGLGVPAEGRCRGRHRRGGRVRGPGRHAGQSRSRSTTTSSTSRAGSARATSSSPTARTS